MPWISRSNLKRTLWHRKPKPGSSKIEPGHRCSQSIEVMWSSWKVQSGNYNNQSRRGLNGEWVICVCVADMNERWVSEWVGPFKCGGHERYVRCGDIVRNHSTATSRSGMYQAWRTCMACFRVRECWVATSRSGTCHVWLMWAICFAWRNHSTLVLFKMTCRVCDVSSVSGMCGMFLARYL